MRNDAHNIRLLYCLTMCRVAPVIIQSSTYCGIFLIISDHVNNDADINVPPCEDQPPGGGQP